MISASLIQSARDMKVCDFTECPIGTLVVRSRHFVDQQCGALDGQLGILVDKIFVDTEDDIVICYPIVHWERSSVPHVTHPANVDVYRSELVLPAIDVE